MDLFNTKQQFVTHITFSLLCFLATAWGVWSYPLPAWPLAAVFVVYATALWCWPASYLIVLPLVLPAVDLGVWTGWVMVGESDLFVLVTIGILLMRQPLDWADVLPRRLAGAALLLLIVTTAISAAIGLMTPVTGAAMTSNPYLRPDNAFRLAKPLAEMLALLPFMRGRYRIHGDLAILLGWGMLAGAVAVGAETMLERAAFPGVFNFASDYRVAAAFSSMHVGGGHIGAYMAMTLPFLLGVSLTAHRWRALPALFVVAAVAGYTLIVTFARTAYAAALASTLTAMAAWLLAGRRATTEPVRRVVAILMIVPILASLIASASSGFMRDRLGEAAKDLLIRQSNWRHFQVIRDNPPLNMVFGAGLGTYPRIMLAHEGEDRPSDFRLEGPDTDRFLTIAALTPLFIGQKIILPLSGKLKLTVQWRAMTPNGVLSITICEKYLLYSDNCRGQDIRPATPGSWEAASIEIPLAGLGQSKVLGRLNRPIEFSLFSVPGATIAVKDLSLIDDWGWQVLSNANFQHGMDRWIFTDDRHVAWRIFNLYLMLLFETGILGLLSFAAVSVLAIGGGVLALRRGEVMGAAIAGAVVSFLVSGLFDNVMEAPRLATVFLLVCGVGLILWEWDTSSFEDGIVLPVSSTGGPGAGGGHRDVVTKPADDDGRRDRNTLSRRQVKRPPRPRTPAAPPRSPRAANLA